MRKLRRARLFVRDYFDELPMVWSLARMRDCERWGGHYWEGFIIDPLLGYGRQCSGCGTFETSGAAPIPPTSGTGSSFPVNYNASNGA